MGFLIFLLLIILFLFLWPYIRQWMRRRFERKMEDMLRGAMGMPPREKEKKQKEQKQKKGSERRAKRDSSGRKIPPEYAVDVDYVEIKEYTETHTETSGGITYTEEKQVVDAEWVEIREK